MKLKANVILISLVLIILTKITHEYGILNLEDGVKNREKTDEYESNTNISTKAQNADLIWESTKVSKQGWGADTQKKRQKDPLNHSKTAFQKNVDSVKQLSQIIVDEVMALTAKNQLVLKKTIQDPQRGIVVGMVYGNTELLSRQLEEKFRSTGLSHLLSASGYNVSLVFALIESVCQQLTTRKKVGTIMVAGLFYYCLATGFTLPIIRASFMAIYGLLGSCFLQRQNSSLRGYFATIIVLIFFDAKVLTSVSFQLSATATLGILTAQYFPIFQSSNGLIQYLIETSFLSFIAIFWTSSVQLHHFGAVNLSGVLNNVAVGWLVPIITLTGFVSSLIGLSIWPISIFLNILTFCFIWIVELLLHLPQIEMKMRVSSISMWISFCIFILLPGVIHFFKHTFRKKNRSFYLCS